MRSARTADPSCRLRYGVGPPACGAALGGFARRALLTHASADAKRGGGGGRGLCVTTPTLFIRSLNTHCFPCRRRPSSWPRRWFNYLEANIYPHDPQAPTTLVAKMALDQVLGLVRSGLRGGVDMEQQPGSCCYVSVGCIATLGAVAAPLLAAHTSAHLDLEAPRAALYRL